MASLHGWLGLILGFSGLIFIHELGHFLLAKWNGVKVHVFSLGWGPYIFSFTWRGTVYALSLIPVGGYVQMAGQNDLETEEKPSKDPTDYRNKTTGQRAQIIAAGAIFNIIFTLAAFTLCYWEGMEVNPARIGMISPDKPLAQATLLKDPNIPANLHEGDRIVEVNGVGVKTFLEAMLQISASPRNQEIVLKVERETPRDDGARIDYVRVAVEHDKKIGAQNIGLLPWQMTMRLPLGFTTDDKIVISDGWLKQMEADPARQDSPAYKAGLKEGDEIVSIGGVAVEKLEDMLLAGPRSQGKPTAVVVRRGDKLMTFEVTPKFNEKEERYLFGIPPKLVRKVAAVDPESEAYQKGLRKGEYIWGFQPDEDGEEWGSAGRPVWTHGKLSYLDAWDADPEKRKEIALTVPAGGASGMIYTQERPGGELFKAENLGEALSVAWGDTLRFSGSVFSVLRGLFTGDVGIGALSGGIGIGHAVFKVASHAGFLKFLWFLGFISLNLGVLQFVPIPLLDGFHLVMLGIERLKGSPVAPKVQITFQWVGILIVGSLILVATYNDLFRIFTH